MHRNPSALLRAALLAMACCCIAASAVAQSSWPDKPITMVVPFPPGGVADTVARPVAEALSRELRQSVVVDNRAGAGGAVGLGFAARAPAAGYTVLLARSSISIIQTSGSKLISLASRASTIASSTACGGDWTKTRSTGRLSS